ncbi:DinB/UmuC family translesion DNA polymerase [Janthinobacterium sp. 13]|uniref:DinB/UmuC family translesion DNA polymerase n=1 Tax=Janthinobacterium sp. 13 TaxID=2035211 RepID=UPI0015D4E003|nr:DUF4113 domain-containing protein [Janthinobacterium sp. 13]
MKAGSIMRAHFGAVLERTCNELRGISCLELEEVAPPREEIVSSRSFGSMVMTAAELGESISTYAARTGEKLRGQRFLCGAVHVFVQTNRFREKDEQYSNGITIPLEEPSADNRILACAALHGLAIIFRDGFKYKKAGIMLMDLQRNTQRQGVLFDAALDRARSVRAMAALDALNERFRRDTVHLGSAGLVRRWAMLLENRIPRYTTSWGGGLPKVFAR